MNMSKDFIEQLQEIQERPLNDNEQEHLKKYVQDTAFSSRRDCKISTSFRHMEPRNSLSEKYLITPKRSKKPCGKVVIILH